MKQRLQVTANFDFSQKGREIAERHRKRLERALVVMADEIVDRSSSGTSVSGAPFRGYSGTYSAWRKERGYQTNPVNLTVTGDMLGAINSAVDFIESSGKIVGRIFFNNTSTITPGGDNKKSVSASEKARNIIDGGRDFFGLDRDQRSELVGRIKRGT